MNDHAITAFLRGYYGMQNTGDDAFLAVAAWGAQNFCQSTKIYATASRVPRIPFARVRPLGFRLSFHGMGIPTRLWERFVLKRTHWIVWGGGSVLHSAAGITQQCRCLDYASHATAFAIGVSVGPFRDAGAEAACGRLLQRLAFVGVRDRASFERARSISPRANVKLTFDLAPALSLVPGCPNAGSEGPRSGLGISLCNYERFVGGDTMREETRLAAVANAVRAAADASLLDRVVLIDFNGHPYYGDHDLHRDLAERIGSKLQVEHIRYNDNPVAVLQRVRTLRAMLAMRLHAAVFAFCAETPTVMLCYHEKCREWGNMIRLPSNCMVDAREIDPADLESRLERLCGTNPFMPEMPPAEATTHAMENWTWLTQEAHQ